ncbi:MAG: hypothetical protein RIC80_12970 [Cyclobacteriaceae bacterium]
MPRFYVIILFLFFGHLSIAQTQYQKDSLINEMCKTLDEFKTLDDSIRIHTVYNIHLYPFLSLYPEVSHQEIGSSIFIRFQHNCNTFKRILDRLNGLHEDWENLNEKPVSETNSQECDKFLENRNFWYHDSSGDTVKLTIGTRFWTDSFKDGTYSKLKFQRLNNCQFEIEFIESNNKIRANFSKPGDRYKYELLRSEGDYFYVLVELTEINSFMRFKLYKDK